METRGLAAGGGGWAGTAGRGEEEELLWEEGCCFSARQGMGQVAARGPMLV